MPDMLTVGFLLALGLIVGSFLNVCIYRIPFEQSIAWPGSHCTSCERPLAWYENVPVASWIALRGRCRTCRSPIAWRYPIVEAITAAVFVAGFYALGWTPLLAVRLLFACALIVLFAIDLDHQILPDVITKPGIVAGLVFSFFLPPGPMNAAIAAAVGYGFPRLVAEIYLRVRGHEGMGMGDFKMLAMVGAFLGWPLVWITLLLSCALGIVIGGGGLLIARRGLMTRIPFGTFIAVAALVCALWGPQVTDSYNAAVSAYLTWALGP